MERVLGRLSVLASPLLDELRPLTHRSLSRRAHRHYRGFAENQLRFLDKEPTVKKLLYVLRTATNREPEAMGLHNPFDRSRGSNVQRPAGNVQ